MSATNTGIMTSFSCEGLHALDELTQVLIRVFLALQCLKRQGWNEVSLNTDIKFKYAKWAKGIKVCETKFLLYLFTYTVKK